MSFIIGHNVLLGSSVALNSTTTKRMYGATQEAVLPANQRLIAVHVGWSPGNGSNVASVKACLYDQGNAAANKPMIAGSEITIPYNSSSLGSSNRWVSVTGLSIDFSAHAGKTLAPGLAPPGIASSGFSALFGTVGGASRVNSTVTSSSNPNPFVAGTVSSNQAWSLYFEFDDIPAGQIIDSIGAAGVVRVGSVENILTTGLSTLTTATVGGIAAAAISAAGGDGTITLADFVDGVVYPSMGAVTTIVGDGTNSASKLDTTLTTKSGWQYVSVTGLSVSEFSLANAFGGGDIPTQLHVIDDGTGVLNSDGTLTNWAVGTYTCWARMASGTWPAGTMKSFTFTVHEPMDTAGSGMAVSTAFSSPVITQNYSIAAQNLSVSTDFSAPTLSQSILVQPNDFDVAVQLSQPSVNAAGYVQIDDFNLSVLFSSPAIISAANIAVNDWAVSVSLSNPLVGDLPIGPIYADTILQIIDSKIIVKIH